MKFTILHNCKIYSVNGFGWEFSPAEAMAIDENGLIAKIGSESEIFSMNDSNTEFIDLHGATVLPGFIDSHAHIPGQSMTKLFQIALYGILDMDTSLKKVSEFVSSHGDLEEYFGAGFNMGMTDAYGNPPCASLLDKICADKPVVLKSSDGHSLWLNSFALKSSGISQNTPEPVGGHIHRDKNGNPTGLLTDCMDLCTIKSTYNHQQQMLAAKDFIRSMNEWGYTAIHSVGPYVSVTPYIYKALENDGNLTAHISLAPCINPKNPSEDLETLKRIKYDLSSELIDISTAKYFIDGVMEGYTAYLKAPYDKAAGLGADYNAIPDWTINDLKASFKEVLLEGFNVHCHCIGDGATSMALDALEYAQSIHNATRPFRNVLTHLQLVNPSDIKRMSRLGIIAALQPFWHFKEPGFYETVDLTALGKERAETEYPAKAFINAGVIITASGDFPVTPVNNPFYGIKAGVIRNIYNNDLFTESISDPDDSRYLLGKNERLTVKEMIEAYTINGAFQMLREDKTGSLCKGKFADYIVIDKDPFSIDVMDLDKIKILRTVFKGKKVYESNI